MARNPRKLFKRTALFALITLCLHSANAGVVRDDVDYQLFRDFAENKGKFAVGVSNIEIKDKDGKSLGVILNGVPMPDFSAVQWQYGANTLISPQYLVSVAHLYPDDNAAQTNHISFGYSGINFDQSLYWYSIVNQNHHPDYMELIDALHPKDYKAPRLNKLVTEVAPVTIATPNTTLKAYLGKYSVFTRMGSGLQATVSKDWVPLTSSCLFDTKCKNKAIWYAFPTGGEVHFTGFDGQFLHYNRDEILLDGKRVNTLYGKPMMIFTQDGDSGSPVFGFNKETKKWEVVALTVGGDENYDFMGLTNPAFSQTVIDKDNVHITISANQVLDWTDNGDGKSTLGNTNVGLTKSTMADSVGASGLKSIRPDLDDGKTVHFMGKKGTLNLKTNINQGAGALYFNNDFTVKGESNDTLWLGAGVSVAKDKTVTWQIKNPENDRLSKIGEGTLLVNGTGDNRGDISVGDGLVVLNQKDGKAFNKVHIVSGRGTVQLTNDKQLDTNNLYFGYRGGRLDTNGNNLSFDYIANMDEGGNDCKS